MNFHPTPISPLSGAEELRRISATLVMLTFGIGLFSMTVPIFLIHVFDKVLISGSVPTLFVLCLLGFIGLAAHGLFTFIRRQLTGRLSEALKTHLTDRQNSRQVTARMDRGASKREKRLAELIGSGVPIIVLDLIVSAFALGVTFLLSFPIGLAIVACFPLLWLNYETTRRKLAKQSPSKLYSADTQSREIAVATFLKTTLQIVVIVLAVTSVMAGTTSVGALIALLFLTAKCVGPVDVLCARLPLVLEFRSLMKERPEGSLLAEQGMSAVDQAPTRGKPFSTSQLLSSPLKTPYKIS